MVGWLVGQVGLAEKEPQIIPPLPLSSSSALFWNLILGSTGLCKSAELLIAGKSLSYGEDGPGSSLQQGEYSWAIK